jgi:SAM-dependent methyltransferase
VPVDDQSAALRGPACPECGRAGARRIHDQPQARYFPRVIWHCTGCGFAFVHPPPAPERLRELYALPGYFDRPAGVSASELLANPRVRGRARSRLRWLRQHAALGRLLDVGCHRGEFVYFANQEGWSASGADLSEVAIEAARELTGACIFGGDLAAIAAAHHRFDVVTAWEVIEHVRSPPDFLSGCRALLGAGDSLALSTPNQRNYHGVLHGDGWKGYVDGPEHLHFFNANTLATAVRRAGFDIVSVRTRRIAPVWLRPLQYLGFGSELEMLARAKAPRPG